jgi:hypothetical protein
VYALQATKVMRVARVMKIVKVVKLLRLLKLPTLMRTLEQKVGRAVLRMASFVISAVRPPPRGRWPPCLRCRASRHTCSWKLVVAGVLRLFIDHRAVC